MAVLAMVDHLLGREKTEAMRLEWATETMTVRDVIRSRIQQEVAAYNATLAADDAVPRPKLLVTPTETEALLNAKPSKIGPNTAKKRQPVDWEAQYDAACKAFTTNGFFVLVDDKQVDALDEPVALRRESEVTFIKLVPLVGG